MLRLPFLASVLILVTTAAAQCTPQVVTGTGTMGFLRANGLAPEIACSCAWDPDGPGPATMQIAFAGTFDYAAAVLARRMATFDPATGVWAELGGGLVDANSSVGAMLPLPGGGIVVGGSFSTLSGVTCNSIAFWNGTNWSAYGTGLANRVQCLALLPNGDLIAGGTSLLSGWSLVRWTGTAWVPFAGPLDGPVHCLAVMPNGDLVAGGDFTVASGGLVERVARWNGTSWAAFPPVPSISTNDTTDALAVLSNGDLVVGRAYRVLRYDGTTWSTFGSTPYEIGYGVRTMMALPNGELLVGGSNSVASMPGENVYRWNGSAWQSLGGGCSARVQTLTRLPNGDVIGGGAFETAGGKRVDGAARWNGSAWSPLAPGTTGTVFAVAATADGHVVGGAFDIVGGVACRNVARFVNGQWQALGSGVDGPVHEVLVRSNGDIVVAGDFLEAGGLVARRIARWNGSVWSPLGSGCNWNVHALAEMPNGDLVATGEFTQAGGVAVDRIARWNGSLWSPLSGGGIDHRGSCLFVQANGDLLVGGEFAQAGGVAASNVARWDGVAFHALSAGSAFPVTAMIVDDLGGVVVGRRVTNQSQVARFDGAVWTAIPGLPVSYLPIDVAGFSRVPGGNIVMAANFPQASTGATQCLWRLDNGQWSSLTTSDGQALAIASTRDHKLVVGGAFTRIGGKVSTRVARVVPPCPPSVTAVASGCVAATVALSATTEPWLGEVAGFEVQGLASNSIAIALLGAIPLSAPLVAVHPAGAPGCLVLTIPDASLLLSPTNGAAAWAFPVPRTATLVGVTFRSQAIGAEFAASGLVGLTASNGVVATLGTW